MFEPAESWLALLLLVLLLPVVDVNPDEGVGGSAGLVDSDESIVGNRLGGSLLEEFMALFNNTQMIPVDRSSGPGQRHRQVGLDRAVSSTRMSVTSS